MTMFKKINLVLFYLFSSVMMHAFHSIQDESQRDILLEIKGSLFVPTNHTFREIYKNCGDFGVELTGRMLQHLYAFASADFIAKHGSTTELASYSKINIVSLALGAKYFLPFTHGDFYLGIGIQPTSVTIKNQIPSLLEQSAWVCGGVAKSGVIFNIAESFFTDVFFDYSFAQATFISGSPLQINRSHLDGCVFGVGFGYRFN